MLNKLRVVQIRILPEKGNTDANFANLMSALKNIKRRRVDIVVTSECFLDGYVSTEKIVTRKNIFKYAIVPSSSCYLREISKWALLNNTWFIFGCTRRVGEEVYNSAIVYNRSGNMVGIYDKVHCQSHDKKYTAGKSLPVFKSDFGLFGVMICADRRWPETARTLALKGARIIFNPTYGMNCDLNLAMMRTRSFESEVIIVFTHPKQSLITGPGGEIITNDRQRSRRFTRTILDLARVDHVRQQKHSHLKDMQPKAYFYRSV